MIWTSSTYFSGFLSTPPRGRRPCRVATTATARNVSIHASAREATDGRARDLGNIGVSIHASAREATQAAPPPAVTSDVSIHASAREATEVLRPCERTEGSFYPRLRAGGDASLPMVWSRGSGFYPRLRAGGDPKDRTHTPGLYVFLSTPPRGRRLIQGNQPGGNHLFLSTPPRGRRQAGRRSGRFPGAVSIHASAREATLV